MNPCTWRWRAPVAEPGPVAEVAGGVVLQLHVQPGAARSGVVGRHGDAVKVKVAAPPVDGKANAAVVALVAEVFGVRPAQVSLVAGDTSRAKRVRVDGLSGEQARAVLTALGAL